MSTPTSETILTDLWGRIISNHNQTVVLPVPGIPGLAFNHNQTVVRR